MEEWPSSVGLRGQALNHPELRWLKTVVVSVREKAHKMRQVGSRKTCQKRQVGVTRSGVVVEASKLVRRCQNQGSSIFPWNKPGGRPPTGQAAPGVEAA
jgi:hypothetical protein